jgi:hypothetical protein
VRRLLRAAPARAPGAVAYQLYNGTYNCVVTIKTASYLGYHGGQSYTSPWGSCG